MIKPAIAHTPRAPEYKPSGPPDMQALVDKFGGYHKSARRDPLPARRGDSFNGAPAAPKAPCLAAW